MELWNSQGRGAQQLGRTENTAKVRLTVGQGSAHSETVQKAALESPWTP